ncbi:MAG: Crp/Fnr family transcriptional regulator [Actinomycetota bacterium]|nr:Crp/Fnr family transcriptional regulator [Actinomycetota bacterium]
MERDRTVAVLAENKRMRLLSEVDVFETLPHEELLDLTRVCRPARYGAGETIFEPETASKKVFVLEEGQVRTYRTDSRGREVTLEVLREGTVFGRLGTGERAQGAYAQAMVPSVVSTLGKKDMERLVKRRPEVGLRWADLVDERLSLSEDRATDLVQKEIPARLASLLLRLVESEGIVTRQGYKITTRYTHRQLGTMIGAEREAVTRAFALLRRIGAVEVQDRLIRIPEPDVLRRAAASG